MVVLIDCPKRPPRFSSHLKCVFHACFYFLLQQELDGEQTADAGLNTQLTEIQGNVIQMRMQTKKDLVVLQEAGVVTCMLTVSATVALISQEVSYNVLLLVYYH